MFLIYGDNLKHKENQCFITDITEYGEGVMKAPYREVDVLISKTSEEKACQLG
jgi:hypothetical protein